MTRPRANRRSLRPIRDAACAIVRRTGDLIRRASSEQKAIRYNSEVDLITRFDRRSQAVLLKELRRRFPDFGVLSEEAINIKGSSAIRWVIDPLDGTTNFAHNLPIWALSVGLEMESEIVIGIVYDPTRNELFSAIRHGGAYLNGKRIHVSATRRLEQSLLVTGFPYDVRRSRVNNLDHFARFAVRAQAVRRLGSAALDLCYTACGRFDGYWELKLSPWDQAAGSLILRESGGRITDFKGRPFNFCGNEVLGTNGLIHRQMMRELSF
jgi:myo-inositol-1(or 4)-monophosphatase